MALDFPDRPNTGDTFTSGSVTWRWNGTVWLIAGSGDAGYVGDSIIRKFASDYTTPSSGNPVLVGNVVEQQDATWTLSGSEVQWNGPRALMNISTAFICSSGTVGACWVQHGTFTGDEDSYTWRELFGASTQAVTGGRVRGSGATDFIMEPQDRFRVYYWNPAGVTVTYEEETRFACRCVRVL